MRKTITAYPPRMEASFFIPGKVPSKKNEKRMMRGRLITAPKTQERLLAIAIEIRMLHWFSRSPLTEAHLELEFHVSSLAADLDNRASSLLDCLTSAGVLRNDSMKHLHRLTCCYKLVKPGLEGVDVLVEGVPVPMAMTERRST